MHPLEDGDCKANFERFHHAAIFASTSLEIKTEDESARMVFNPPTAGPATELIGSAPAPEFEAVAV